MVVATKDLLLHGFFGWLVVCCQVKGQVPNDPYLARGGPPMSAAETAECDKMELVRLKNTKGVYFGDKKVTWRVANDCCNRKSLQLLSNPALHIAAIEPLGLTNWETAPWIGTNDIITEGQYEWASGGTLPPRSPPFNHREPNGGNRENCGQAYSSGFINDTPCSRLHPFLCEDRPPPGGEKPKPNDTKICEKLEYTELVSTFRATKVQSPTADHVVNRPLATVCCKQKGWQLASLKDLSPQLEEPLAKLLGNNPYWTSGSNLETKDIFTWGSNGDEEIAANFHLWNNNSPQHLFNERHCIQVSKTGEKTVRIRDVSCNLRYGIICQEKSKPDQSSEHCCIGKDNMKYIFKPGKFKFQFVPTATLEVQTDLGYSMVKYLSPSKVTEFNWEMVWQRFYLDLAGNVPVPFSSSPVPPIEQPDACVTKFLVWPKHTAFCNNTSAVFIGDPKVVAAENVTTICSNKRATCPGIPCKASDRWEFYATHTTRDKTSGSKVNGRVVEKVKPPCFVFKPPIDENDFMNAALIYQLTTQLSPSKATGINWANCFAEKAAGTAIEDYSLTGSEVPEGHFLNVYILIGSCGNYTTEIKVYKKVLFKSADRESNCQIATKENVQLQGC